MAPPTNFLRSPLRGGAFPFDFLWKSSPSPCTGRRNSAFFVFFVFLHHACHLTVAFLDGAGIRKLLQWVEILRSIYLSSAQPEKDLLCHSHRAG